MPDGSDLPKLAWEDSTYSVPTAASLLPSGSGTVGAPYLISSTSDINNAAKAIYLHSSARSAVFKLSSSIDMSGVLFPGLGTSSSPFTGTFDGNSNSITNLSISVPSGVTYAGLFPAISGRASIKDLTLTSPSISATGIDNVGALIGMADTTSSAMIQNIAITGASVTGANYIGGVVGGVNTGSTMTITACSVSGSSLSGSASYVGGLAGFTHWGATVNIIKVFATSSTVSAGASYAGGIIGFQGSGTFTKNYASTNVSATTSIAGGIAGQWNGGGTFTDSYAGLFTVSGSNYGSVTTANNSGGAIGYINNGGTAARIYSTVVVSGAGTNGGLIASGSGANCTGCYWDTITSGQATSASGTGAATAAMQMAVSFTGSSWDDTAIWNIVDGSYPTLR